MPKVAIATTGGHYYTRPNGKQFYSHLAKIAKNRQDRDCYIVSWKPRNDVPSQLRESDSGFEILYRENKGLDPGCYHDFIKHIHESGKQYDYLIVCHDDIDFLQDDWHDRLIQFMEENQQFDFASPAGNALIPDHRLVDVQKNAYVKCPLSQLICMRVSELLFRKNPFVILEGKDVRTVGNDAITLSFINICNIWGSERVGWSGSKFDGGDPKALGDLKLYKRGTKPRELVLTSKIGWPNPSTTTTNMSLTRPLSKGYNRAWLEEHNNHNWKCDGVNIKMISPDDAKEHIDYITSEQLFEHIVSESKTWKVPIAKVIKRGNWIGTLRMLNAKCHPYSITHKEFDFIRSYIVKNRFIAGYDLATAFGISALAMAMGMQKTSGKVLTLDGYIEEHVGRAEQYEPHQRIENRAPMGLTSVKTLIDKFMLHDVLFPKVGWSPENVSENVESVFGSEKIDIVFIDGGHTVKQLIDDVCAILPFLNDRFTLIFHDWGKWCEGDVTQFFMKKFGNAPVPAQGCPSLHIYEHNAELQNTIVSAQYKKASVQTIKTKSDSNTRKRKKSPTSQAEQLSARENNRKKLRYIVDLKDSERETLRSCILRTITTFSDPVDLSDLRLAINQSWGVSEQSVLDAVLQLTKDNLVAFNRNRKIFIL